MPRNRLRFGIWLEWLTAAAVVSVAVTSLYKAFWAPSHGDFKLQTCFQLWKVAGALDQEPDPVKREALIKGDYKSMDGVFRMLDTLAPANARIFALIPDKLGIETGTYFYLTYYLFPREVAISLGRPPSLRVDGMSGQGPKSVEQLQSAGYDFLVQVRPDGSYPVSRLGSSSLLPPDTRPKRIPGGDGTLAFLLPLAVAVAGSRLVRWLFRDLESTLSTGELLASGLALGAFLLTQLTLGMRLAGARLEQLLAAVVMVWALGEGVWLIYRWRQLQPRFKACYLWWLLLVPMGLIFCCQFRLAGLLGLQEFDGVAIWAFKAKILHYCAGQEIWTWFKNPALTYAHMDYPLLVPLLHALTYGLIGHVNEFVTRFWNQWMLLLLAWAVLGAVCFPGRRAWLAAAGATVLVVFPMTREWALTEGATIPMLFYVVLSSIQLAVGMVENQPGRLRLGVLLLIATAMVKFEGAVILGLWVLLLVLDRESRMALWPPRRLGWAALAAMIGWTPYAMFRLNSPVPHPQSAWLSLLFTHASDTFHIVPMTWVAMLSRRFLNNDFAEWLSPDQHHALWQGHWTGLPSLVDNWTQGAGWVCVLLLLVAWSRGGRLRWTSFRLYFVFLTCSAVVSIVWSAVQPDRTKYSSALSGSAAGTGGRYLYPMLMAWLVGGLILLLRAPPAGVFKSNEKASDGQRTRPHDEVPG